MKTDVIIGAITKYPPKDIQPWVESIEQSGFKGDKVMIIYQVPQDTIQYLESNNFIIYDCGNLDILVHTKRFLDIYEFLSFKNFNYSRVIFTDVRDVVFQSNPSEWLDAKLRKKILVGSESILCKDMKWAQGVYSSNYPLEWPRIEKEISYCCGVIAGEVPSVKDFLLAIYRWSLNGVFHPITTTDQAAMNVLMNMDFYKKEIQKVTHKDGWVTHLGVSLDKPGQFGPYLMDTVPEIVNNKVVNDEGVPFTIVHQWDRIPDLNEIILTQYQKIDFSKERPK